MSFSSGFPSHIQPFRPSAKRDPKQRNLKSSTSLKRQALISDASAAAGDQVVFSRQIGSYTSSSAELVRDDQAAMSAATALPLVPNSTILSDVDKQVQLNVQLLRSIMKDDVKAVETAINQGASARMSDHYAPLHLALEFSKPEIVFLLLRRGASQDSNANDQTRFKRLPLFYALNRQDADAQYVIVTGLLLAGADPALLSPETKKRHVNVFNKVLTGAGWRLDIPSYIEDEKKRIGMETLNVGQWAVMRGKMGQTLRMVKNITTADITDLNLAPLTAQYNQALRRTNQNIEHIYSPQSGLSQDERIRSAQEELSNAEFILQTGLPFDSVQLNRYAEYAAILRVSELLDAAIKAGASPELRNKYNNPVDDPEEFWAALDG